MQRCAMRGGVAVLLCVAALGCNRQDRPPATGDGSTSFPTPAPTAPTTTRVPELTAAPIPGLETAAMHGALGKIGFTAATAATAPGFVTTTSKRTDATVSTYGRGPSDVVKVVAEADRAAARAVLVKVATAALPAADAKRAAAWITAELKKGPVSPTQPRASNATYAKQPYELLVTASTATLSIGRITSA